MSRKHAIPAAARQFVNGTAPSVTVQALPVRMGFSPALRDASMARLPSKRDRRRADRRDGRRSVRADQL